MGSMNLPIKLNLPEATQESLSFCAGNTNAVTKWAKALPMANTGAAAKQLYLAMRELNQWQAEPELRFEVLEVLRPYVHSICGLLNKHFIQSSVALNDKQLQVANLAQTLQGYLATGYKIVVAQLIRQPKLLHNTAIAKVLTTSIHRAISDTGQTILRAFQLYNQPPSHAWLEVNQLYFLAETNQLTDYTVEDKNNTYLSSSSIHDAFVRIHLVASARPNNLRQQDLATLYSTCELWTQHCLVTNAEDESSLFIFNLHRDRPAQYRQNLSDNVRQQYRGLKTKPLIDALKLWASNPSLAKNITVPKQISDNLLSHVIQSWSIHWQRSFRRAKTEGRTVSLCLGMSAAHYYSANQTAFERHIAAIKPESIPESVLNKQAAVAAGDAWSQAFDADKDSNSLANDAIEFDGPSALNNDSSTDEHEQVKYPTYQVDIVNASPGGYSLSWTSDVPPNLQAGEIIGVQEPGVKNWSIGVIRWIRQSANKQTPLLGIELLAPKAEAGAARLIQKTGNAGPLMRALLLPAIKAIAQPATLLLPHIPFRTGHKVELVFAEELGRFQLVKRLTSTNSFTQFQYRSTTPLKSAEQPQNILDPSDDNFDNIWNKL